MQNQDSIRALRRHHALRRKAYAKRIASLIISRQFGESQAEHQASLVIWANHSWQNMHSCSCLGCGNPRRHAGRNHERLTLQEQRFALVAREATAED